jgi:hypothetical protein
MNRRPIPPLSVALTLAASLVLSMATARAQADPDWPCIQRKVATISAGAVWSGPPLPPASDWEKDYEAASLAQKLASRRTPLQDVDGLLDAFVEKAGDEKPRRLTNVFAGVLDLINTERNRVLEGIDRYSRGQKRLADRIRSESDEVGEVVDSPMSDVPKSAEGAETAMKWDARIFDERRRSLTYVCEVPVLLEKRAFEIGRLIQARL